MKIASLKIQNFRTLESMDLGFPASYSAICGANDSGKTNIVRAIRSLMREGASDDPFESENRLSLKEDFPKWSDLELSKREIAFELKIVLHKDRDAGFYQFVCQLMSIGNPADSLEVVLKVTHRSDASEPIVVVIISGIEHSGLNAQEILKKLQSSKSILFHNSTQLESRMYYGRGSAGGYIREISGQHESLVSSMKKTLTRGIAKISKSQQSEFEALLGRLQTKYKVGLSCPAFDFGYLPFNITLGDRKMEVPSPLQPLHNCARSRRAWDQVQRFSRSLFADLLRIELAGIWPGSSFGSVGTA